MKTVRWYVFGALAGALALAVPRAVAGQQPRFNISGSVFASETREPLPGAQVVLRGTDQGALTDKNGKFSFDAAVPAGSYTVAVSYIGRQTVTRQVTLSSARPTATLEPIYLEPAAVSLQEVVVTAPGVQAERQALGNSIATVSGEAISRAPAATGVGEALEGKITGATITQLTGQPGGALTIRLRGTSSINGSAEPLIVVDGTIVDDNTEALIGLNANASGGGRSGSSISGRLQDISPDDIDHVEVLKGASAAALYGSRAKNGVILIFTKKGQQGQTRVNFSSNVSLSSTPKTYDLNMAPTAGYTDQLFVGTPIGTPVQRYDIQDQIFRTGLGTNNSLSLSGGSGGTSYYIAGHYDNTQGILRTTNYTKEAARLKLTQQLGSRFSLTGNANFIQSGGGFLPEGEQTQGVLTSVIFTPTTFNPAFDSNTGRYPYNPVLGPNPLEIMKDWQAKEKVTRFIGDLEANAQITDKIRLRYLFGLDDYRQEDKYFQPPFSMSASFTGSVQNPVRLSRQFNHDLTLTDEARLAPSFGLTSTLGFRYTSSSDEVDRLAAQDLPPGIDLVSGATQFASQGITEIHTVSAFLQEQLALGDRFYLTPAGNLEASSAFGTDQRWQFFPHLGASWLLGKEPWFQSSGLGSLISTLRLRAAYGQTGGQPPSAYARFNNYIDVAFSGKPGLVASAVAGNPDLKPERQREIETGFDLGVLKDRANLEFTYYNRDTKDLVLDVPLPPSSGFSSQPQNIGEIGDKGIEAALNTVNVSRGSFEWSSRLSLAHDRTNVKRLVTQADTLVFGYLNAVIVGQPLGVFYGGVYARNPDGTIKYAPVVVGGQSLNLPVRAVDASGTPIRRVIGDPTPNLTAQLGNTFRFGKAQLYVLFDGRFGNDVANFSRRIEELFGVSKVNEREINGDTVPRTFSLNPAGRSLIYEEYVENGSFVKLREVSLSLQLPSSIAGVIGASAMDVRVAGRNLFTWTNYSGLDPEVSMFGASAVAQGVDFANTPIPRSFVLGVNLHY